MAQHRIKTYLTIPLALTLFLATGQVQADDLQPAPAATEPATAANLPVAEPMAEQPSLAPATPSPSPLVEEVRTLGEEVPAEGSSPEAVRDQAGEEARAEVPVYTSRSMPDEEARVEAPVYTSRSMPDEVVSVEDTTSAPSFNGSYHSVPGKYGQEVVIVNKQYGLSPNYAPGENAEAKLAFNQLRQEMRQAGFQVGEAYSGYRSYSHQASLYNNYVAQHGQAAADRFSARPGYSEHQTGLAYDLTDGAGALLNGASASAWVAQNAHRHGFIVRYQAGKEAITGYMHEPWHLRYIGREATDIYRSGLTLEEYFGLAGGTSYGRGPVASPSRSRVTPLAAPASQEDPVFASLPASGSYTFTKTTGVKSEAKVSSPDLAFYQPGMVMRYDRKLTADNHNWLSYINYRGGRSYVAISPAVAPATPAQPVAQPVSTKPVSQPESPKPVVSTPAETVSRSDDGFASLPASGSYTFTKTTGVKAEAKISSPDLAFYQPGMVVRYDRKLTADNHNWLSYINYRGGRSYVAISPAVAPATPAQPVAQPVSTKPAQPESPQPVVSTPAETVSRSDDGFANLPASGSYTFTKTTGVKSEAKVSSPDLAFYQPGMVVRYDRKLTADNHNWLSYINYRGGRSYVAISPVVAPVTSAQPVAQPVSTKPVSQPEAPQPVVSTPTETVSRSDDGFASLPASGSYTFTKTTGVKSEAKVSSPDLAFYQPGMVVRYDRKLTADNHNWLSYINYRGGRSYVAISPAVAPATPAQPVAQPVSTKPVSQPEAPQPVVSKPAETVSRSDDGFASLPASGSYTFTKTTGVKSEAKVSSPDLAFYQPGMVVRYDRKLTADNHNWLSYINYRGGRSYVAISPAVAPATPAQPVAQPVSTKPVSQPEAPKPVVSTPAETVSRSDDGFASLPASGSYTFTKTTGVKSEAKVSSPDLAFYQPGMVVRYDRKLTADNHNWLSYINYRGGRSYVAISPAVAPATPTQPVAQPVSTKPVAQPEAPKPVVSKPAETVSRSDDGFANLPASGSYTFTKTTGVKAEAKISSPDLATYRPGQQVHYDRKLTADGHNWLSYINYGGGRSYVAISQATPVAQPVNHKPAEEVAPNLSAPAMASADGDKKWVRAANKVFTVLGDHLPSQAGLAKVVSAIQGVEAQGYDLGFKLTDVATQKGLSYQADKTFYTASAIKAPYVVALTANRPETTWNQQGTIKAVAQQSSNDGYAYLRNTYGNQPMNDWADKSGVSRERVRALYPYLTADELHSLWESNYTYFNQDARGRQVAQWFENPNLSPIKATVGNTYKTQSKAGWIGGWGYHAANDAGIVYTPKGNYILSVMSNADGKLGLLNPLVKALNDLYRGM